MEDAYTLKIVQEVNEIIRLRSFWEENNNNPNSDLDFYLLINKERAEIKKPFVLVFEKNKTPVALFVGRLVNEKLNANVGYFKLCSPSIQIVRFIYGGIIGDVNVEIMSILCRQLSSVFIDNKIDAISFTGLNVNGLIFKNLQRYGNWLFRSNFVTSTKHWKLMLPENYETFLSNMKAKHRTWMKRQRKKLDELFPDQIKIECFRNKESVEKLAVDSDYIARQTYQRRLGRGFFDNNEMRMRLLLEAERKRLFGFVLYCGGEPASFWVGTKYNDVFNLEYTGYCPKFMKLEVGSILYYHMIKVLFDELITCIDFGEGDAFYKSRFGNDSCYESDFMLWKPSLFGMSINMYKMSVDILNIFLRFILTKTGIFNKLKQKWRRRLGSNENVNME